MTGTVTNQDNLLRACICRKVFYKLPLARQNSNIPVLFSKPLLALYPGHEAFRDRPQYRTRQRFSFILLILHLIQVDAQMSLQPKRNTSAIGFVKDNFNAEPKECCECTPRLPYSSEMQLFLMQKAYSEPRSNTMRVFMLVSRHPVFSISVTELVVDNLVSNDAPPMSLIRGYIFLSIDSMKARYLRFL